MTSRKRHDRGDVSEFQEVIDAMPGLVATFDDEGRLRYLNLAGRTLLEWDDEVGFEGAILSDLYSDEEAERLVRDCLPEAIRLGVWTGPGQLVTRKGVRIPVVQNLVAHPPAEGKARAFTIVASGVEGSQLAARENVLTSWLGFLHDLNGLLAPIIAYAALVDAHTPEASPAKRHVRQIQRAAERIRELSAGAVRRIRSRPGRAHEVVWAELVEEVVSWLRVEYPQHRFTLGSPLSRASLRGDAIGLQEVTMNLVRNAAESLPAKGGTVTIELRETEDGRKLRLSVQDDGCGIEASELARIFEPFYSTKAGGTGLGLALTREIVRRHRGNITVEPNAGGGTRFHVDLPLASGPR